MSLLRFAPDVEAQVRRQVRAHLAGVIPAEHVDAIVDLSIHATQTALAAAERVLSAAGDDRHFIAALGPTVGLLAGRCEQLQRGYSSFAAKQGMVQAEGRVTI